MLRGKWLWGLILLLVLGLAGGGLALKQRHDRNVEAKTLAAAAAEKAGRERAAAYAEARAAAAAAIEAASKADVAAPILLYDNVGTDLQYYGHAFTVRGTSCEGRGSFQAFIPRQTVDLTAADGDVISSVPLGPGTFVPSAAGEPRGCSFDVIFPDVDRNTDLAKIIVSVYGGSSPTFRSEDLFTGQAGLIFNDPTP